MRSWFETESVLRVQFKIKVLFDQQPNYIFNLNKHLHNS